jgi:hypothetical protein
MFEPPTDSGIYKIVTQSAELAESTNESIRVVATFVDD